MRSTEKDQGYAWVILASCAMVMFVSSLVCLGVFGVLLVEMIAYFPRVPMATISLVGALQFAAFGVVGFVIGPFTKKVGPRRLILGGTMLMVAGLVISFFARNIYVLQWSYGIMTGVGCACQQIGAFVAVHTYFDKRRAMAVGVTTFMISVGVMSGAPLAVLLIRAYTLPGSFLMLAAIVLQCLWLGALLRPLTQKAPSDNLANEEQLQTGEGGNPLRLNFPNHGTSVEKSDEELDKQATSCTKTLGIEPLKNIFYCLYVFSLYMGHLGHFVPFALLPLKAMSNGQSETIAALLVTYIAGVSSVVILGVGVLGDKIPRYRGHICSITNITAGALTAASAPLISYWSQVLYAVLFGIVSSFYVVFQSIVPVDMWGLGIIETFTAHLYVAIGVAMLTLNPVNGAILDHTNNPNLPFLIFGLVHAGGGFVMLLSVMGGQRRANATK